MRRLNPAIALLVAAALCLVAWGLSTAPAEPEVEPTLLPPLTFGQEAFTCVQPLRDPPRLQALIIGDSNIFGPLGKYLERSLAAVGYDVARRGKPTSGLARPDYFDWTVEAKRLLEVHQPALVIAMFGGNDGQRLESTDRSVDAVRIIDGGAWSQAYQERVQDFARLLRGEGRSVFILSPTNRRPRFAREKMQKVRAAQREGLEGMRGVTWIDMFPLSSDANGRWLEEGADVNGNPINYRREDGIHLTPAGGQLVGRRLLERLMERGLTLCGDG